MDFGIVEIFALVFLTVASLKVFEFVVWTLAREIETHRSHKEKTDRAFRADRMNARLEYCRKIREAIAAQHNRLASNLVREAKLEFGGSL